MDMSSKVNQIGTNNFCTATKPRPRAFSLWSHLEKPDSENELDTLQEPGKVGEYTTWPMLTDRSFSARHLPPAENSYIERLPIDKSPEAEGEDITFGDVTNLFRREETASNTSRSSILFTFFAQWFTDSLLRIDPKDRRKNTSTHNIDLCQIYGRSEKTANLLRDKRGEGKLKSRMVKGHEYLDRLGVKYKNGKDGEWEVKESYKGLPYTSQEEMKRNFGGLLEDKDKVKVKKRLDNLYATGLERGNSSIGYIAISTLFMREHNRICDALIKDQSGWEESKRWDDERLFQTARMINIVILMKLVVQDYINHISRSPQKIFKLDPTFAEQQSWYRTPWIAFEFDLLYRWHSLVPEKIEIDGKEYGHVEYRKDIFLMEDVGIDKIINDVSTQAAGKIQLKNTPEFLLRAEYAMIKMGRDFRLKSYNDYRDYFGLNRLTEFSQLTGDKDETSDLHKELKKLYKNVDDVEFVVGIFAETPKPNGLFGELMNRMVGYDAFTQIYTNPLLSKNVYGAKSFSKCGMDIIDSTNTVQDLVDRNRNWGNVKATFRFK